MFCIRRHLARGLQGCVGIALFAGLVVVSRAAPVNAQEESVDEAQQALNQVFPCSNAGGTQAGALSVEFQAGVAVYCYRMTAIPSGPVPPPPPATLQSCWSLAKFYGCPGY